MSPENLSIVVPVLNDGAALQRLLQQICGLGCEIIVADAGSADLPEMPCCARVVRSVAVGRGQQLAAAVAAAGGDWIWMLHADSRFSTDLPAQLWRLEAPSWGRFDVHIDSHRPLLRMVASMMNWRSRLSGICTGDQGLVVHRSLLNRVGGVPEQPLMEDIELSRRLKRLQRPVCLPGPLSTSARRWEQRGAWRTIVQMWWLRLCYWSGAAPADLAQRYYHSPSQADDAA